MDDTAGPTMQDGGTAITYTFEKLLSAEVPTNKAPSNFTRFLELLCPLPSQDAAFPSQGDDVAVDQAERDCAKALLSSGFIPFFLYVLVRKKLSSQQLQEWLSRNEPKVLGQRILEIQRHESIDRLIQHVLWTCKRCSDHRRYLEAANISFPLQEFSTVRESERPSKRARPNSPSTLPAPILLKSSQIAANRSSRSNDENEVRPTDNSQSPLARFLPLVFDGPICNMIVRNGKHCEFWPVFPENPSDCCFYIKINACHVVELAKAFYGVTIWDKDGRRSIRYDSGAFEVIDNTRKLQGANVEIVELFFGKMVNHAFSCSQPRQQEYDFGFSRTSYVEFYIPGDPDAPGEIRLMTQEEYLTGIVRTMTP
ncbi:hypothetical protein PG994_004266 [Apiospora phragmitis]|uniref:Uncharacterized protein n=1 Tax=Apiospora phragmitis TaxID=2905665 RepID=A0ABR1VQ87_9PEZI